jgi:hypothetical protein
MQIGTLTMQRSPKPAEARGRNGVDRNSKALFASSGAHPLEPPSTLAAGHPVCPVPCGSPAAAPRRRTALRGFGWCWTGAAGWGRECLRGALERRPREGRLGRLGGKISNGISKALQA